MTVAMNAPQHVPVLRQGMAMPAWHF